MTAPRLKLKCQGRLPSQNSVGTPRLFNQSAPNCCKWCVNVAVLSLREPSGACGNCVAGGSGKQAFGTSAVGCAGFSGTGAMPGSVSLTAPTNLSGFCSSAKTFSVSTVSTVGWVLTATLTDVEGYVKIWTSVRSHDRVTPASPDCCCDYYNYPAIDICTDGSGTKTVDPSVGGLNIALRCGGCAANDNTGC